MFEGYFPGSFFWKWTALFGYPMLSPCVDLDLNCATVSWIHESLSDVGRRTKICMYPPLHSEFVMECCGENWEVHKMDVLPIYKSQDLQKMVFSHVFNSLQTWESPFALGMQFSELNVPATGKLATKLQRGIKQKIQGVAPPVINGL